MPRANDLACPVCHRTAVELADAGECDRHLDGTFVCAAHDEPLIGPPEPAAPLPPAPPPTPPPRAAPVVSPTRKAPSRASR